MLPAGDGRDIPALARSAPALPLPGGVAVLWGGDRRGSFYQGKGECFRKPHFFVPVSHRNFLQIPLNIANSMYCLKRGLFRFMVPADRPDSVAAGVNDV